MTAPEQDQQAKRALAYVIGHIRPDWTDATAEDPDARLRAITDALTQTSKAFPDLAADAIDAARTPELKTPRILITHRAPARPPNPRAVQPPPATRCSRCGNFDDDQHHCQPAKPTPTWHEHRKRLAEKYTYRVADAKTRGDHAEARRLQAQWRVELAEVEPT